MSKLNQLLEIEGLNRSEFLENYALEAAVPAICMNADCEATYNYEPDQDEGWCDVCDTNSVKSGLVLMGVI